MVQIISDPLVKKPEPTYVFKDAMELRPHYTFIDTHAHLDGEEFKDDLDEVILRAKSAGVSHILVPGIDESSLSSVFDVCSRYPHYLYPMIGLQPEEVKADYEEVLDKMKSVLDKKLAGQRADASSKQQKEESPVVAIGECGLDFYWSREFEKEQLRAFEKQVEWSVETQLPLMIHCRKAQNELIHIMRPYEKELPGGVFHCFTGNQHEAEEYLRFDKFVLGVGGVSTFKSSHLAEDLPAVVPLSRIVLETDSPYMAPVPHRGKRNESAFVREVLLRLAAAYEVSEDEMANKTNENVARIFKEI